MRRTRRRAFSFPSTPQRVRAELDEELTFHLDSRIADLVASGLDVDRARVQALAEFGDLRAAQSEIGAIDARRARAAHRRSRLVDLWHDARLAVRTLRRQRLPAVAAIACLALGIGASTTVFSVGNTMLLRPMPFPTGDRLVSIGTLRPGATSPSVASLPEITDWRSRTRTLSEVAALTGANFAVDVRGEKTSLRGARVSANLFRTLGAAPLMGRDFDAAEDVPGAAPVAMIGEGLATRMFGSASRVVGEAISLNGRAHRIVGVVREHLRFPDAAEVWVPLAADPLREGRGNRFLSVVGLLAPGAELTTAQRDLDGIAAALAREHPDDNEGITVQLTPLRDRYVANARPAFTAVSCAVLLMTLIAIANVSALQLARAAARDREITVRAALGASRGRIVTQLLTESVVLALAGGAAGVWIAVFGGPLLARTIARSLPSWMTFDVDLTVLLFTVVSCVSCGILFGLAPAWQLASRDTATALRRTNAPGLDPAKQRLFRALVVCELGASFVLLVGALFALHSYRKLSQIDVGFDAGNAVTMRVFLDGARYAEPAARAQFASEIEARLQALPGVAAAGATTLVPVGGGISRFGFEIEGRPDASGANRPNATGSLVTPGYFRAIGMRLLRGREFDARDRAGSLPVAVVGETFAKTFWPGEDAIGKRFHLGNDTWSIIGIVGDIKQVTLTDGAEPQFYRPEAQDPWEDLTFVVRGSAAAITAGALRQVVSEVDPALPVVSVISVEDHLARSRAAARAFGGLLTVFAVAAIVLAWIGVYGVSAYYVSKRTSEIGIRMALGADRGRVMRMMLRQGGAMVLGGVIVGGALSYVAVTQLARLLFDVRASEPALYLVGAGVIAFAGAIAIVIPSRRASLVSPLVALRSE